MNFCVPNTGDELVVPESKGVKSRKNISLSMTEQRTI